jgi:hypothetical protein
LAAVSASAAPSYPEHGAQMIAAKKTRSSGQMGFIEPALKDSCPMRIGRGLEIAGEVALDSNGKFLAAAMISCATWGVSHADRFRQSICEILQL